MTTNNKIKKALIEIKSKIVFNPKDSQQIEIMEAINKLIEEA